MHINIEIKAKLANPVKARAILLNENASFTGTDLQVDTYFKIPAGRLKLREGNIENNLIYYLRADTGGPKQSDFKLMKVQDPAVLKSILTTSLGILKIVSKTREIYYLENVKFHIDQIEGLGNFIEIEAGNLIADKNVEDLHAQCQFYIGLLDICEEDMLEGSYSDMI